MDAAEAATKSVVEHKGSARRCGVFWGYLRNYQQDTCTAQREGLYGKCRVLKNTDERACRGDPRRNQTATVPGEYLTRFSVPLIPNNPFWRFWLTPWRLWRLFAF